MKLVELHPGKWTMVSADPAHEGRWSVIECMQWMPIKRPWRVLLCPVSSVLCDDFIDACAIALRWVAEGVTHEP